MRIVTQAPTPKKKTIKQIVIGQAFRLNECWFVRVNLNDDCIRNFSDFYDKHVIQNTPQADNYNNAVPVLSLATQSLCYVNGDVEVEEWGTIDALITTAL